MRKILILILIFIPLLLNANMASPVGAGTLVANPFLNQYVKVLHENIFIKIDSSFQYADFDIEYQIFSEKNGFNIPFLFYAYQYEGNFKVTIDGKEIKLKTIVDFWDLYSEENKATFKNFEYLFNYKKEEISNVNDTETGGINLNDFLYFETNIAKGKHRIKISYKASRWSYKHSRINEYSFKYVLSPAKYWKSFGTLDITIDASDFKEQLTTNLNQPTNENLAVISKYHFETMPTDVLSINFNPKVSKFTQILINLGGFGVSGIVALFFIVLHLFAMKRYRNINVKKRISPVAIIGSLIIPFIFVIGMVVSSGVIDHLIGKHASGRESYGSFFMFFLLPKFWLYYIVFTLIVDSVFKKIIRNKK